MIMNITTALESIKEQRAAPLVENDNHQQIYRWDRNYLLLILSRGVYMDWDLRQSVEGRIFLKSSFTVIYEKFSVPKTSLKKVPECNLPATEMFFSEASVVSPEFRKNQ